MVSRANRQVSLVVSFDELLAFMQENFRGGQGELSLPFSGSPLPFVKLDGQTKIEPSWELANALIQKCQSKS